MPDCLLSWAEDPDGDGVYVYTTKAIPPGNYEAKVAINESWTLNYGANASQNGANIGFTVPPGGNAVTFRYDSKSHALTIRTAQNGSLALAQAHWVSRDTIAWKVASGAGTTYRLHYDPAGALQLTPQGISGGQALALTLDPAGLIPAILTKFPYLIGYSALKLGTADGARAAQS